ncbi:MAG: small multi-drug export protein [Planctomycetia bacterium]
MSATTPPRPAALYEPPPRGWRRAALVLGPLGVTALAWAVTWMLGGSRLANESLVAAGLFLTIVGATVILGPSVVGQDYGFGHLTTWQLVGVTAFMTVVTAFFWTYNLDLLERIPRLGPILRRSRMRMAGGLAEHPWIRRLAVFGVGFFVLLPLPGSGTLGGSLVARIVGLKRKVGFLAVSAGGLAVTVVYGQFGDAVASLAESYELGVPAKVALALGFVASLWIVGKLVIRLGRETRRPEPAAVAAAAAQAAAPRGPAAPPPAGG